MPQVRAGTAAADITPRLGISIPGYFTDRQAADILDPIRAKALVIEAGDARVALVVCDVICVVAQDVRRAKDLIGDRVGIPPENVMVAATHTHYGPATIAVFNTPRDDAYCDFMVGRIADAVALANLRLQSAAIGWGAGEVIGESFNRRWLLKDGRVVMNPGHLNPDRVRAMGPVDPELGLLAAMTPEGQPAGAFFNFSLHYVGGPYHDSISADYFGAATAALPRMWGRDFLAILGNGCCGDINNCDWDRRAPDYPYPFYQAERVGNVVAAEACKTWRRIWDYHDDLAVGGALAEIPFTRRQPTEEQIACMGKLLAGPPQPESAEWMYAGEYRRILALPPQWPVPIQALRVGDVGIVGLPGEVFVEIGLAIKKQSPFQMTMVVELANDWAGYIPTDRALGEGSYETDLGTNSMAAPGTEGQWVSTAVDLLKQLAE
jgi:hypothetical protein